MEGISVSEAIRYGIKHMTYLFIIYVMGFYVVLAGFAMAWENQPVFGLLVSLIGLILLFGGLHGAMYKISGDATARVLQRSRNTANKIPTAQKIPEEGTTDNTDD